MLHLELNPITECDCDLCQRSRRYYRNLEMLSPEEQAWMKAFYDYVINFETERDMEEVWSERVADFPDQSHGK